ncbi:MAG: phosphatidylglycerophosphatase A [Leptospirales bacterium]
MYKFIATGFYSGLLKPAPGTWGSLAAIFIIFLFQYLCPWNMKFMLLLFFLFTITVGTFSVRKYIRKNLKKDPSEVVIDEWAGQALTFVFVATTVPNLIAGFILFRFLDILKPWPIKSFEKLPGEWGIMLDDIAAGILAATILWGANLLFRIYYG